MRGLLHNKCIVEKKEFAAIATNVGQKESGSCPADVVVGGVEVCGGRVEVCRSGEGMWDSAGSGTVRWHV